MTDDLPDRMRQFEVVCKTILKMRGPGSDFCPSKGVSLNLEELADREFGLEKRAVKYCIGRARLFLECVNTAHRLRAETNARPKSDRSLNP